MVPPGYLLGQVAAPRPEEPEEPLYVNAKQVSPLSIGSTQSNCLDHVFCLLSGAPYWVQASFTLSTFNLIQPGLLEFASFPPFNKPMYCFPLASSLSSLYLFLLCDGRCQSAKMLPCLFPLGRDPEQKQRKEKDERLPQNDWSAWGCLSAYERLDHCNVLA